MPPPPLRPSPRERSPFPSKLGEDSDFDAKRLALLGGSKGVEAALLISARHAELVAVVAGIERSPAPVLLVCGEADSLWPSCPMADQLAMPDPRVRILRYADAGHAVFGAPLPEGDPRIAGLAALGGTPAGDQAARIDGWPKVLAFLAKAFGGR